MKAGILFIGVLLWAGLASAQNLDINRMADDAALIVRANAAEVDVHAYQPFTDEAFTYVRFEITEVLDGDHHGSELVFYLPGGIRPDGSYEGHSDMVHIVQGYQYILFLKGGEWAASPFVGDTLGVFREETKDGVSFYVNDTGQLVEFVNEYGAQIGLPVSETGYALQTRRIGWGLVTKGLENIPTTQSMRKRMKKQTILEKMRERMAAKRLRKKNKTREGSDTAIYSMPVETSPTTEVEPDEL